MLISNFGADYELIKASNGQKLERWGDVVLSRPDPQIIWKQKSYPQKWKNINATYHRSKTGGGAWEYNKKMPNQWQNGINGCQNWRNIIRHYLKLMIFHINI